VAADPFDVTALHVVGMGGGLSEWVRDSFQQYDSACWRAAPLEDPRCDEEEAPLRGVRGTAWSMSPGRANASFRDGVAPGFADSGRGFRCVYVDAPTGNWR
jgi:formylglycine-generating enzyme required for sulfatase activity